jgi:Terminase large subunit, T4likevirus-type, N-terminal
MSEYDRGLRKREVEAPALAEVPRVSEWARTALGCAADERQAELLDSGARWLLLCCSRQWGKSTVTAIRVVHHVLFQPGAMVVVAGPAERQSGEFLAKVAGFLRTLGIGWKRDGLNEHSMVLPNGSRLVAVPGREAFIRGFSAVTFLIIDEASKAPDSLYTALTPMLATTDGMLWLMGTPNGQAGFFYEEWVQGGAHWKRMSVPATECGRIGAEFLARERVSKGEDLFRREYLCEFLAGPGQMFTAEMFDACIEKEL